MKLQAETGGEKYEVEVRRYGGRVFARIGDREYELEASEPEANVFLLKHEGRVFEAFVDPNPERSSTVRVGASEFDVALTDPKRLRASAADAHAVGGKAEIKTAMPGKVVRILVGPNASVQKGDGVIVVEAMKMQNEMKSPKDGSVTEIRVSEGDTVVAGDVLVVID